MAGLGGVNGRGFLGAPFAAALIVLAGLASTGIAAEAQSLPKALATTQVAGSAAKSIDGAPRATNFWICASGVRLEVYPVSFDDAAPQDPPQFVLVYRQAGVVIASERIDARTARLMPTYGCDDRPAAAERPERIG